MYGFALELVGGRGSAFLTAAGAPAGALALPFASRIAFSGGDRGRPPATGLWGVTVPAVEPPLPSPGRELGVAGRGGRRSASPSDWLPGAVEPGSPVPPAVGRAAVGGGGAATGREGWRRRCPRGRGRARGERDQRQSGKEGAEGTHTAQFDAAAPLSAPNARGSCKRVGAAQRRPRPFVRRPRGFRRPAAFPPREVAPRRLRPHRAGSGTAGHHRPRHSCPTRSGAEASAVSSVASSAFDRRLRGGGSWSWPSSASPWRRCSACRRRATRRSPRASSVVAASMSSRTS